MQQADNYQFKRGGTSVNDSFTGPEGSISVDEEERSVRIHDGVTPGGAFRIMSAMTLDAQTLEFSGHSERYIAAEGQTSFNPAMVDLSIKVEVAVTVNGTRMESGWEIVGTNIVFDQPLSGNDEVDVANVKSLKSMIKAEAGETNVESVIVEAIETATGATGVTLGSLVTNETLESAIEQIDITSAVNSAINNADGVGGTSLNDILTTGDSIDLGLVN